MKPTLKKPGCEKSLDVVIQPPVVCAFLDCASESIIYIKDTIGRDNIRGVIRKFCDWLITSALKILSRALICTGKLELIYS